MHAHLLVMDFLSTMRPQEPSQSPPTFDCYVDNVCLDHIDSPINLKTHWHEELVFRTAGELKQFQRITAMSIDSQSEIEDRRDKLRCWYGEAIRRKLGDFNNEEPYKDLTEYRTLFEEMRKYDRVIFFGGCSLTILEHILKEEPTLGKKVEYYQQGVCSPTRLHLVLRRLI